MERPNFLLVMTDQHRADHLGCAGNPVLRTPHIDGLAARGTRFDRFYVANPVCMPNRASLMTGRLPSSHMVRHNGIPLPLQTTTFANLLRAAGYQTALVGKAHLQNMTGIPAARAVFGDPAYRDPPADLADGLNLGLDGPAYDGENARAWAANPDRPVEGPFYGFDHVRLCGLHGDLVAGHYTAWLRDRGGAGLVGPDKALPDDRYSVPQAWRTRVPEDLYPTAYVAEQALAFLDRMDGSEPFLLKVSFPDPHHPFTPPGRYWDLYDPDDMPPPRTFDDFMGADPPPVPGLREVLADPGRFPYGPQPVTERQAREAMALTYGMIAMVDDAVGRILARLEEKGLAGNTVVLFTSDHGDFMGDRGVLFKFGMHYQELIRVPFIWADPARPDARVSADLAGTIDIAPTLLARAGLNPPFGTQGRDLFGAPPPPAMVVEDVTAAYVTDPAHPVHFTTLVTGRWRLTRYEGCDWGEMFDLENDPEERRNLWPDPAAKARRGELHEALAARMLALAPRALRPVMRA
ncbi:MAG: sulfatase-like hydrolase/transferase [Hyphomicrobiales bacterium]|nr:sulfatase-like hydrolase/transferase [Hyphomicrobiales bacterium]